mmetsp:Transcript_44260/g.134795  ORF Transcript_44260/g.134795 Transcript_44260/m.134795 type:complete len:120 (+) Transcript_44260:3586-3945(+)
MMATMLTEKKLLEPLEVSILSMFVFTVWVKRHLLPSNACTGGPPLALVDSCPGVRGSDDDGKSGWVRRLIQSHTSCQRVGMMSPLDNLWTGHKDPLHAIHFMFAHFYLRLLSRILHIFK